MSPKDTTLTALLISPNRELAENLTRTLPSAKTFQVIADLRSYPTEQALDLRLRQMAPQVVLVDVMTDLDEACGILQYLASYRPQVHSVGLHMVQDGDSIVRVLRAGATEFLFAPFDEASQREVCGRIARLSQPEEPLERNTATVCAFACTKPGSGASTIAAQVAFAIRRLTGKRVLLADFDLTGGTIGFYLKAQNPYSLLDALELHSQLDPVTFASMITTVDGVDVLASPEEPHLAPLDATRLEAVLDVMRNLYDFVILDLPTVFDRSSLLSLAQADSGFLITTAELPSLHLTRKALQMLQQLGFDKERLRVIVNRLNRKDGLDGNDLGKMFNAGVHTTLPNDYFSLHRVVTRGEPLNGDSELVRALEGLAGKIAGLSAPEKKKSSVLFGTKPVLSQI
jgi:pilus assembly protein CpaE